MTPQPDLDGALSFLRLVRPSGWWVLVAICPETGKVEGRSFATREDEEARAWITDRNEKQRNIYWTVNPVLRPLAKKPAREDIAALEWLHVDVDPDKRKPLADERARIEHLFGAGWPADIPRATLVVDSGGGYQAFWRLTEPTPIGGQQAAYDDAARYNQQLEARFAADACHNVDRIMRVPGTVNWPNAKKRAAGRTPALARLLSDSGESFALSSFIAAAPRQVATKGFAAPAIPNIQTGNVARLQSLDELPPAVSGSVRVVINAGHDPNNPKRWPSRSEPLFWVCCELLRAGVTEEMTYSVITDPDFRISESVLEKGSGAERYALHCIANARQARTLHPQVADLNERHAVIADLGGKCRILSEGFDDTLDRPALSYQSFEDFIHRYANRFVQDGEKQLPLGRFWIQHPGRREFDRVVFSPEREVPGAYNLWRGFAYDAIPGDCSLYLEHLRRNVCRGNEEHYEYLLNWMASAVQHPAAPGQTAVVIRGLRGTGKGVFAQWFGKLFGRHFMQITNAVQLVGQFNFHLKDCVVLFADEAFYAGDKRHEAVLKSLVTESKIVTEAKYQAAEMSRNCLHIIMASNADWVVPAGSHERRFLVLDAGDTNREDTTFFGRVEEQMLAGGLEALLHMLRTRDITAFTARKAPRTAALQEQKEHSLGLEEEWWYEKLRAGQIREGEAWPAWVACTELAHDFGIYAQRWGRARAGGAMRLVRLLERAGAKRKQLGRRVDVVLEDGSVRRVDRPRVYEMPPLEAARESWAKSMGGTFDWTQEVLVDTPREESFA